MDGDENFRSGLAAILRDDGHRVREYPRPGEIPPLATLDRVAAIIGDDQMSGRNWLSLVDEFHARFPHAPVVLVSAYWSQALEVEVSLRNFVYLRRKPVKYDELRRLLQQENSAVLA